GAVVEVEGDGAFGGGDGGGEEARVDGEADLALRAALSDVELLPRAAVRAFPGDGEAPVLDVQVDAVVGGLVAHEADAREQVAEGLRVEGDVHGVPLGDDVFVVGELAAHEVDLEGGGLVGEDERVAGDVDEHVAFGEGAGDLARELGGQ